MFRLAVTDIETGILSINVSAIEKHKYAKNLFTTLNAFLHTSPIRFVKEFVRLPDSDERNECILYYSVLLHELRHFLDILVTPYGAWRIRNTLQTMVTLPQLLPEKEPLIIPLALGADSFYAKHKLGLDGFEDTFTHEAAKQWKKHKAIIGADNRGFSTENGRIVQYGGEAILEALAFGVQADLVRQFADDAAGLKDRFPSAFDDLQGPDPTHIDVTYRWYAFIQTMIGKRQTTGVAKLVTTAMFASLCGTYHSSASLNVRTSFASGGSGAAPYDLTPHMPNSVLQMLIGDLVNRFENVEVAEHLSWEEAWEIVDHSFKNENGITIFQSLERDCEFHESFFHTIEDAIGDAPSALSQMLEDAVNWYRSHLEHRRRVLKVFERNPHWLVDSLTQMSLFGKDIHVPVALEYPTSTNQVIAGSIPVDVEISDVPHFFTKKFPLSNQGWKDRIWSFFLKPKLHQNVYYSSFFMKGASFEEQKGFAPWFELLSFQVPFFKSLVYGDDPMDISGRSVQRILNSFSHEFPTKFHFVKSEAEQVVVSSVENYMDFHDLETAQCDYCASKSGKWLKRSELVSVSAAASRNFGVVNERLTPEIDQFPEIAEMKRIVDERDWSENRICMRCFKDRFPQKLSDRYFNV